MRHFGTRSPIALLAATLLLGMALSACDFFPEPDYVAYSSGFPGARDIAIVRPDGGHAFLLTANGEGMSADNFSPVWDPLGQRVAFLSDRDGNVEVYVATASESNTDVVRVTNSLFDESQISWSFDGTRIAYTSERFDGLSTVQQVELTTLKGDPIVFGSDGETDPAWSPTEALIVFSKLNAEGEPIGIFLRDPSDVNIVQITAGPHHLPVWSPDGTRIAFLSTHDGQQDIYIIGVSERGPTTEPFRLTEDSANDYKPVWSHDGSKMAFISDRSGNADVYTVNTDGTGIVKITQNAVDELSVQWGSDDSLLFPSGPEGQTSLFLAKGDSQQQLTSGAPATAPDW